LVRNGLTLRQVSLVVEAVRTTRELTLPVDLSL